MGREMRQGQYRLGEILRAIRGRDYHRVRIAVLTRFSRDLLTNREQDLEAVDDIWEKRAVNQDYLSWQIGRIKRRVERRQPNHALIESLNELLDDRGSACPWEGDMKAMLVKYQRTLGEREQVEHLRSHLINIGYSIGMEKEIEDLLGHLIGMEPLNVAGDPRAWGHLRHVINVFWLGYFLINSGFLDIDKICKVIDPDLEHADRASRIISVNSAWYLAALFHDLGLMAERIGDILGTCLKLTSIYPVGKVSLRRQRGNDKCGYVEEEVDKLGQSFRFLPDQKMSEGLESLTEACSSKGEALWLERMRTVLESEIDHGILSGITLLRKCEKVFSRRSVEKAAVAAALHNFPRWSLREIDEGTKVAAPELYFNQSPITSLLIFCDNIEVWDRRTGLENRFEGLQLESSELAEIEKKKVEGGGELRFHLNYVPYRYILPQESEVDTIERKLQSILLKKVYPTLSFIRWPQENFPVLSLDPWIYGRKSLPNWSSRKP